MDLPPPTLVYSLRLALTVLLTFSLVLIDNPEASESQRAAFKPCLKITGLF